jgi:hypothetical protein
MVIEQGQTGQISRKCTKIASEPLNRKLCSQGAQNDENRTDLQVAREYINIMKRLILASLLAVFAASGALGQQIIVTVPGGHDREWYEHHGYVWHDGQWYRGEPGGHDREWYEHHGYVWRDGQWYRGEPGGHDREWYEHHGYVWRDGQWYRGEGHHHHDGYWKDGHYYRYDEDRD